MLLVRIDRELLQTDGQLWNNIPEDEGVHGTLRKDCLPRGEDGLGRGITGVPPCQGIAEFLPDWCIDRFQLITFNIRSKVENKFSRFILSVA